MIDSKAIILLSGGIDSLTCLAIAKEKQYSCYALAVDYGQKHRAELEAAKKIAQKYQCKAFRTMKIDLGEMAKAALTDPNERIPEYSQEKKIKSTYFPARNTIFLSMALAWAESLEADKIIIGANLADYYDFPDTRPDYFEAFTHMAKLATRVGREERMTISIETPLLGLDKAQIIQKGIALGVDYSMTVTCYQANSVGAACAYCDSCVIRKEAFESLRVPDPTLYAYTHST